MTTLKKFYKPWAVNKDDWGVEITEGSYNGTVIKIEKVEFADEETGELQVDYHLIRRSEALTEEDYAKSDFRDTLQLIISDILSEAIRVHKDSNGT